MKTSFLAIVAAAALSVATLLPAHAQQEGLVNVSVEGNQILVPIQVAANVCGVSLAVIAEAQESGEAACEITGEQAAEANIGRGQGQGQNPN